MKKEIAVPRWLCEDGGWNVEYSVEGTILTLKMDLSKPGPICKSGKSWTVACTRGPNWLGRFGFRDMFVNASLSKALPISAVANITPDINDMMTGKYRPELAGKKTPEEVEVERLKAEASHDEDEVR